MLSTLMICIAIIFVILVGVGLAKLFQESALCSDSDSEDNSEDNLIN